MSKYEEVSQYIKSKDCILLSTEYKNNKEKLSIRCSCGRPFERSLGDFKKKSICKICSGNSLSYEQVSDTIKAKGCKLLSKEYKNNSIKLDVECSCGNPFKVDYNTFKKGQTRCKKCYWKVNKHHNKKEYIEVKNFIEKNSNCKLISKDYIDGSKELEIKCECKKTFYRSYNSIKKTIDSNRTLKCEDCIRQKVNQGFRLSKDEILSVIDTKYDSKFEILEYEDSLTNTKEIDITIKHKKCGHIFSRTANRLLYTDVKCPYCENKNKKRTIKEVNEEIKELCSDFTAEEYIDASNIVFRHDTCQTTFTRSLNGVFVYRGLKCPKCEDSTSIGMKRIIKWLEDKQIYFIREYKFEDCRNVLKLPFDIYLPKFNTCIEFDGEHHYMPIKKYGGEERFKQVQVNDKIKNNYCSQKNISLLRIKYSDVKHIEKILENFLNNQANTEITKQAKMCLVS